MEILADIYEPQIPPNTQNDYKIQFSICLFSFNGRNGNFHPLKLNNRWKFEFIDLFVHLVKKYLPRFPYWDISSEEAVNWIASGWLTNCSLDFFTHRITEGGDYL